MRAKHLVLLALAGLLLTACSFGPAGPATVQIQHTPGAAVEPALQARPLTIILLYDVSGSSRYHHIPELTKRDLLGLFDLLAHRGGQIAFGTIPHPPDRGLVRAQLPPRPVEPPDLARGNVFRRLEVAGKHQKRLEQWEKQRREVQEAFLREALPLIRPRTVVGSPVFRAIRMGLVVLQEPGAMVRTRRFLVLVSDGWDTTHDPPVSQLPEGVRLVLVNGSGTQGRLGHLRPLHFATLEAALRFIGESDQAPPEVVRP